MVGLEWAFGLGVFNRHGKTVYAHEASAIGQDSRSSQRIGGRVIEAGRSEPESPRPEIRSGTIAGPRDGHFR